MAVPINDFLSHRAHGVASMYDICCYGKNTLAMQQQHNNTTGLEGHNNTTGLEGHNNTTGLEGHSLLT